MKEPYLMAAHDGEHEIIVDKSRFICHVKRVYSDAEAQDFIKGIKKLHYNANHNCSAYQIGDNNETQRANDDGEPSGTAGVPMLEVLRKQGIKNTSVVVTRYFGGIKLGAGGLIRTYGKAVSEALKAIGLVQRKTMKTFFVHTEYPLLATLQNRLEGSPYVLKDVQYGENVKLEVEAGNEFMGWLTDLTQGKVEIEEGDTSYQEVPLA
ncbi:MAG: YigZ family protein [Turicibacter sp.]|nr:YigZ family protein [Turicibacter sp.]